MYFISEEMHMFDNSVSSSSSSTPHNTKNENLDLNMTRSDLVEFLLKYKHLVKADMEREEDNNFNYVVDGIFLTIVSVVGLLGNLISIGVLSRPGMKGSFSTLLIGLSSFDTLYLLVGLAIFGFPALSQEYLSSTFPIIIPSCYGLGHIGRVGSVFVTVSVTVERYLAIGHPLKRFPQKRLLLPVSVMVAILYNIPKFFELESKLDEDNGLLVIHGTSLRANHHYVTYYIFWSKLIFIEVIPYFIIIILNTLIILKIQQSRQFRSEFEGGQQDQQQHQQPDMEMLARRRRDINLVAILISICVLFILCQSVKIIPDLYEAIFCRLRVVDEGLECITTPLVEKMISVSHLMLAINSSANFFLYIWRGEKFWETLTSHCLQHQRRPDSLQLMYASSRQCNTRTANHMQHNNLIFDNLGLRINTIGSTTAIVNERICDSNGNSNNISNSTCTAGTTNHTYSRTNSISTTISNNNTSSSSNNNKNKNRITNITRTNTVTNRNGRKLSSNSIITVETWV